MAPGSEQKGQGTVASARRRSLFGEEEKGVPGGDFGKRRFRQRAEGHTPVGGLAEKELVRQVGGIQKEVRLNKSWRLTRRMPRIHESFDQHASSRWAGSRTIPVRPSHSLRRGKSQPIGPENAWTGCLHRRPSRGKCRSFWTIELNWHPTPGYGPGGGQGGVGLEKLLKSRSLAAT